MRRHHRSLKEHAGSQKKRKQRASLCERAHVFAGKQNDSAASSPQRAKQSAGRKKETKGSKKKQRSITNIAKSNKTSNPPPLQYQIRAKNALCCAPGISCSVSPSIADGGPVYQICPSVCLCRGSRVVITVRKEKKKKKKRRKSPRGGERGGRGEARPGSSITLGKTASSALCERDGSAATGQSRSSSLASSAWSCCCGARF